MRRTRLLVAGLLAVCGLSAHAVAQTQPKTPTKQLCPVEGKSVSVTAQSPTVAVNGQPRYFCDPGCRNRFLGWPEKYLRETVTQCPVQPNFKAFIQLSRRAEINNGLYYLCCDPCVGWIREKPWLYLKELKDPVTGQPFALTDASPRSDVKGQLYFFENAESKTRFDAEPAKYVTTFRRWPHASGGGTQLRVTALNHL